MLTLKLVSQSNLEALNVIEKLFPDAKVMELRVDNDYQIRNEKVYTIKISHVNKKA